MLTLNPSVSVILPTYNRRDRVQPAIDSVLHQTYQDYELIVIDDASTDGTTDWIMQAHPHVQLLRLPQNRGAAGARNAGIQRARGTLIAFLDSDDEWLPSYLAAQVDALNADPQAVMSLSDHLQVNLEQPELDYRGYWDDPAHPDLVQRLLMKNFIYTMSVVVVRHTALQQVGLLDERLRISHDRELYLRLLQQGTLARVPQALVRRYIHTDNVSARYRLWAKEVSMVLDTFYATSGNESYRPLERRSRASWALFVAGIVLREGNDPLLVLWLLLKAGWYSPGLLLEKVKKRESRGG